MEYIAVSVLVSNDGEVAEGLEGSLLVRYLLDAQTTEYWWAVEEKEDRIISTDKALVPLSHVNAL